MTELRKVKVTCDDDGHWYIIPNELEQRFRELLKDISTHHSNYDLVIEFEEQFEKYRTGGGINLVQLYAEI